MSGTVASFKSQTSKINPRTIRCLLSALALSSGIASILAQEAAIADPGLNAAIREAPGKPNSLLTVTDTLGLTNLSVRHRNVSSLVGLEAARNLAWLDLAINEVSDLYLLSALTKLSKLDLSAHSPTFAFRVR